MRVSEAVAMDVPSARLVQLGAVALSTAELLAIVTNTKPSVGEVLFTANNRSLREIARNPISALTQTHALGRTAKTKAIQIHAALELGRRAAAEERKQGQMICSPSDVVRYVGARMEDLTVEEFHVLILDAQHRLERDVLITRGILNSSLVHPREVFREAIADCACAVILLHNHPSGDPAPSADDRAVTEQLVAAGRTLDIPVHDHIIIGRGRYTSFAEAGLI